MWKSTKTFTFYISLKGTVSRLVLHTDIGLCFGVGVWPWTCMGLAPLFYSIFQMQALYSHEVIQTCTLSTQKLYR